jgi:hypothetical protein
LARIAFLKARSSAESGEAATFAAAADAGVASPAFTLTLDRAIAHTIKMFRIAFI